MGHKATGAPVSASAPKSRKGKGTGKLRYVRIELAANGGFIGSVDREQGDFPYESPQQHALGDRAALQEFIDNHFGKAAASAKGEA